MDEKLKTTVEKAKKQSARPTVSAVLPDGSLAEMLCRLEEHRTLFCVWKGNEIRYETNLLVNGQRLVPYSPRNNLLANEVVLFPSEPAEYGTEQELVENIRAFVHRYVDISPLFEQIASYYVLFTWVYDAFNELPYLRLRGDTGSGKTRFLLTGGSLCYKPIFASGASTVSPLFRILDEMRGTLIIDEGDFRFSDEKAEIVKILNNGNARGFPVLRSESVNGREFSPRAYTVFGPKLVSTRGFFQDRALESRCLTEETGGRKLREDIPINLTAAYKQEALELRNKLLMFRLRNFGKRQIDPALVDRSIEPRLAQIFVPLLSVIEDFEARNALCQVARDYHRDMVADRGMDVEAQVLEIIQELQQEPFSPGLAVKEIAERFIARHSEDFERKITPHWVGGVIRRKLGLKTERHHGNYFVAVSEGPKLVRLFEKYGVDTDSGDLGDSGDSVRKERGEESPQGLPLL
ncbi:MAG: hypothetical protein EPN47_13925 [Acidobacteria bacterium]|nr:MAG: hypothetical protein EPN47_13925 [Acidobacteriota bacterium]